MTDPAALDLLDDTARVLREDLAAALTGEQRYQALLAANAIATARRAIAVSARLQAAEGAIGADVAAIRAGRHDGDAALHGRLLHAARLRAFVADPVALSPEDRAPCEESRDAS
ncbi:hypothetical protein [Paracoccus spongiarum]|uniref:Acyl-CoA dehydrogenase n=1 Tax=Paracoccus spongiarum TaxID=3064387 RepID=A0ABT9JC74_9RHOB|nr:hypothetical protein [Paracoccus sp. 2205BS29-5]MDP5307416.1 hypothetical protein [Paracoccus sp. 2205BS29-5]